MKDKTLNDAIASAGMTIKEVIRLIDHSGLRVAYIVDEERRLLGAVSDSEIRKAILKGLDIQRDVGTIVNPNPIVLQEAPRPEPEAARRAMQSLLERMPDARYILAVDKQRRPTRLVRINEVLGGRPRRAAVRAVRNILIVGGAGYLGAILVRKLLRQGYRVRVLDMLAFGLDPNEELADRDHFSFIGGDLRHISTITQALADIDAVINLAAVVGDPACKGRPEMTIEINYLANKVLADACRFHQINRFVYASTCSVYGAMEGEQKLDEKAPLNPVSLYARSKIQSEQAILGLIDENFSPTVLRMGTLHGYSPRMRFDLVVNTMTKAALTEGRIHVHGGGKQWRPLLHVEDAADAYIQCLEAPLSSIRGEVFNVGSEDQNLQIIDIAKAVRRQVPRAKLVVESGTEDPRNYVVSFEKIRQVLKFKRKFTIDDSIARIRQAIEAGEIGNVNDPKYYNVEAVQ